MTTKNSQNENEDKSIYGVHITKDGKRIDPKDFYMDEQEIMLLKALRIKMEEYGMPVFKDNLPAMDILQSVKDAGYTRTPVTCPKSSELSRLSEKEVKEVVRGVVIDFSGDESPEFVDRVSRYICQRFGTSQPVKGEKGALDEKRVRFLFEMFQLSTDHHRDQDFPCIPQWNFNDLIELICKLETFPAVMSVEEIEGILDNFRRVEWIMINDKDDTDDRIQARLHNAVQAIIRLQGKG